MNASLQIFLKLLSVIWNCHSHFESRVLLLIGTVFHQVNFIGTLYLTTKLQCGLPLRLLVNAHMHFYYSAQLNRAF